MAIGKPGNRFGGMSPWSWAIEPVRGCNLRCGHCATRLFPKGETAFMSEETWRALWSIIPQVTPHSRVEMANAGEPTLHPNLPALIQIARRMSPSSQIQITTNGTMIASGALTYRTLFAAGVNIVYVDMYAPREKHVELARQSGIQFYEYHNKPAGAPGAWEYSGPDLKLIVLMDHPGNWPDRRKKLGRLGTFFNHLDWPAAKSFGMVPVDEPVKRRCSQPFHYVSVCQDGRYELCCQDFFGETCGLLGSVHDGLPGFERFWFGEVMQYTRARLREADRAAIPWCSRCSITFSRSDFRLWQPEQFQNWWDGTSWKRLEGLDGRTTFDWSRFTRRADDRPALTPDGDGPDRVAETAPEELPQPPG